MPVLMLLPYGHLPFSHKAMGLVRFVLAEFRSALFVGSVRAKCGICLWESAAVKLRVESYIWSTDNTDNYTLCMLV